MRTTITALICIATANAFASTDVVQLGAYTKRYQAENLAHQLKKKGIAGVEVAEKTVNNRHYYIALSGPFDNKQSLNNHLTLLKKSKVPYFLTKSDGLEKKTVRPQTDVPAVMGNLDKGGNVETTRFCADSKQNFIGINGGYAKQRVFMGYISRPEITTLIRNKTYDEGSAFFGLALGHDFERYPLRIDFKYTNIIGGNQFITNYVFNQLFPAGFVNANVDVNSQQYMVDAYYLLHLNAGFLAYAGGGVGISSNTTHTTINNSPAFGGIAEFYTYTNNSFAYNAEVGFNKEVGDNVIVGAFGRYTGLGKVVVENHSLQNNGFEIGDKHGQAMLVGINVNFLVG